MINDPTTFRTDWMPFAGRRESGYGTGGIPFTMRDMTQEKMILMRRSYRSTSARHGQPHQSAIQRRSSPTVAETARPRSSALSFRLAPMWKRDIRRDGFLLVGADRYPFAFGHVSDFARADLESPRWARYR